MSKFTVQPGIFELYEPTKESAVYTNTYRTTDRQTDRHTHTENLGSRKQS